jgi:hypothetical protein
MAITEKEVLRAADLLDTLPAPGDVAGIDPLENHMLRTHALLALIAVRLEAACSKLDLLTKNDPANWR